MPDDDENDVSKTLVIIAVVMGILALFTIWALRTTLNPTYQGLPEPWPPVVTVVMLPQEVMVAVPIQP